MIEQEPVNLQIWVEPDKERIVLQFDHSVAWVKFNLDDAINFAQGLLDKMGELSGVVHERKRRDEAADVGSGEDQKPGEPVS
jgi:hypothetical protein